jgi:hypothetical protein
LAGRSRLRLKAVLVLAPNANQMASNDDVELISGEGRNGNGCQKRPALLAEVGPDSCALLIRTECHGNLPLSL